MDVQELFIGKIKRKIFEFMKFRQDKGRIMKRINAIFILLLWVVTICATSLFAADNTRGKWEVGPYGGGIVWTDDYSPANLDYNAPLAGLRIGHFLTHEFSLEASFQRGFSERASGENANLDSIRLNGLWHFLSVGEVRPFLTLGVGGEFVDVDSVGIDEKGVAPNFGTGAKWLFKDQFGIRLDGRYVPIKVGGAVKNWQHNLELAVGIYWFFGGKGKREPVSPSEPTLKEEPKPSQELQPAQEIKPTDEPVDTDHDRDGITDREDSCGDTPKGTQVDQKGCPVSKDKDEDGVEDEKDQCPNTPKGSTVDSLGCRPKEATVRGVLKGVEFKLGSDILTIGAQKVLDEVAGVLKTYPEGKVEIQGHTDTSGDDTFNQLLSEKRAKVVMDYLISKELDPNRFTSKGYGEIQPTANNSTREGRISNRRVELKWSE